MKTIVDFLSQSDLEPEEIERELVEILSMFAARDCAENGDLKKIVHKLKSCDDEMEASVVTVKVTESFLNDLLESGAIINVGQLQ